ncbi:protein IDA-LIKE 4-like [Cucumis melo var. makuwa]|uniref:Protein IDA-LIKE 4-like n=1 Tax=Cucumis melo var. makuwa TaxID=1194695 RepID=A0A5D3E8A2_CUCMM|nr:protein IDA-LIKE 4-like [Cucumis melo var. makuwa]
MDYRGIEEEYGQISLSHGSRLKQLNIRSINVDNHNNSPTFVNAFLPKAFPVPPSGPSMKHNGIITSQYHP